MAETEHVEGWPVSRGSYNKGCRCEGCREARRVYRRANQERIAAKEAAYREAHREEIRARKQAYYEANQEEIRAKRRAHYEANREATKAQVRAYYEAHREEILGKAARRRGKR